MNYYVIAFRARSHTINFAWILNSYHVQCEIISTPRKVNVSCGISIKFRPKDLMVVEQILSRRHFDTFGGIYSISGNGLDQQVSRIRWLPKR